MKCVSVHVCHETYVHMIRDSCKALSVHVRHAAIYVLIMHDVCMAYVDDICICVDNSCIQDICVYLCTIHIMHKDISGVSLYISCTSAYKNYTLCMYMCMSFDNYLEGWGRGVNNGVKL
jgi:hypothetical protein